MTPIQVLQIILGIPLALFLPGYLFVRIVFKSFNEMEKVVIGFVISMLIDLVLVLYLGYNENRMVSTGGITAYNLWMYLGITTIILLIIWMIARKDERKFVWHSFKKLFERHQ